MTITAYGRQHEQVMDAHIRLYGDEYYIAVDCITPIGNDGCPTAVGRYQATVLEGGEFGDVLHVTQTQDDDKWSAAEAFTWLMSYAEARREPS